MKTKFALLSLGLVSLGFSLDEYQPISPKALEVDVGYAYTSIGGIYDADGEKVDNPSGFSPAINQIPLQIKYGIMPGLDVELGWSYNMFNEDLGDLSGFGQPDLAVKYALTDLGLGFFVDVNLPFATGDFSTDPSTVALGIAPGIVYGKNYGQIQAVGMVGYAINMEDDTKFKDGNALLVFLKPGYSISPALGAYLGVKYLMTSESETAGTGNGDDGYTLSVLPGATFTQSPMLAYEVNVPIVLAGKNTLASWGVWASVYVTLGM